MSTFYTDKAEFEVFDEKLKQEGTLYLHTEIDIKGNHLKGAVPVSIKYIAIFVPQEKYREVDPEHPDEEPFPIHYINAFETEEERSFYVENFYVRTA